MRKRHHVRDFVPILGWMHGYSKGWLRGDVTAGVTAAAVVIPKAMAFATIAGLPVQITARMCAP
jgi:SulP family sulfate permease